MGFNPSATPEAVEKIIASRLDYLDRQLVAHAGDTKQVAIINLQRALYGPFTRFITTEVRSGTNPEDLIPAVLNAFGQMALDVAMSTEANRLPAVMERMMDSAPKAVLEAVEIAIEHRLGRQRRGPNDTVEKVDVEGVDAANVTRSMKL